MADAALVAVRTSAFEDWGRTFYSEWREAEYKELVEALGFDPKHITPELFSEAWDLARFLWEDERSKKLITRFAKDYARAQHSLEMAELAGSAAFEVLLTIILAALTGGVGVIASAGSKTKLMEKLRKIGELFGDVERLNGKKKPPATTSITYQSGIGSSQLELYETEGSAYHTNEPPKPARKTIKESYGTNTATWTLDEAGKPISVEARLDSTYDSKRSSEEKALQKNVGGDARLDDDDGGHMLGHRFMSDQGEKNLFPQNSNLNRSAYKKMENEWADWTSEGFQVKLKVTLHPPGSKRPTDIVAKYTVIDPATGKAVFKRRECFSNTLGETYTRVSKNDMKSFRK
ncbi:DNA/RNA non-specific endonuclease [Parendozoicomonas haliclonae]|uniref:Putative ribonuclease YeeF n=1 Tax=Parendozoicomonas haliclonae TaxID=1960125 RepID=A0A1X7AJQ0_9GAMM|nr:DNA/RNA non-specific endonuclease [Parendozoicomonas haliclonae]SMA47068.1 putative ribonuclease YeeF [Parendozoicomonas haliclonae]